MIIFIIIFALISISVGLLYNNYTGSVSKNATIKEIIVQEGMTSDKIGDLLLKNNLIKSKSFFKIYLKLFKINNLKAGKYELSENMTLKDIIKVIENGNSFNENEISITFPEGINMRRIATIIANNTNNTYDDVMNLNKDTTYLKSLIDEYWFINDDILNTNIYYALEGYLYPDTYRFYNKDVSVKDIFKKLLKQMDSVLSKYKDDITKSKYSIHQLLTLSSIAELEVSNENDRSKVVGVFINRLNKKMSLGSDITTRYSIKLDEQRALTKSEYNSSNPYNTRNSNMAGKLPASPICMISELGIKSSIYYDNNDYLYFISNINTKETFFFKYSSDFEKKKDELAHVNRGY